MNKREKEKKTMQFMISLYYRKKETEEDREECAALYAYAEKRIDLCPFMETKTFCSTCKVHRYEETMRERMRKVMRFSGPYMLIIAPT